MSSNSGDAVKTGKTIVYVDSDLLIESGRRDMYLRRIQAIASTGSQMMIDSFSRTVVAVAHVLRISQVNTSLRPVAIVVAGDYMAVTQIQGTLECFQISLPVFSWTEEDDQRLLSLSDEIELTAEPTNGCLTQLSSYLDQQFAA